MQTRKIDQRFLNKDSSSTNKLLSQMIQSLVDEDASEFQKCLSPVPDKKGRYITSEATLDKNIDRKIFLETQIKRLSLWLVTKPPLLNRFFSWLLIKKMKMKLDYFSENEHLDVSKIYKINEKSEIEQNIENKFKIQNFGHATQLIQSEGLNVLTDPVLGKDLAPIFYPSMTNQFKRDKKPSDLPNIDVILISHNHRDHVDESSLKEMVKNGQQPILFLPKGDKKYFEKLGFKSVYEFDWHEEVTLHSPTGKNITFCSVPADHRSGRHLHDTHKSSVSGWIISPEERNEILYFAGDTARLDDTRILSVAVDMYALYMHKKELVHEGKLPKIINLVPGGPNYTRKYMKPTHQSAMDSIAIAFRLALALEKVSKKDGTNISARTWLDSTTSIFMHHNKFQLGPDRFNENLFIYNRMLSYLELDDAMLENELKRQQAKSKSWSLFHRCKDFIVEGVKELKELATQVWPDISPDERKQKVTEYTQSHVHFPLINETISSSIELTSKVKPETEKGKKQIKR